MGKALNTSDLERALSSLLSCNTRAKQFYVIANDEMKFVNFEGEYSIVLIQNVDRAGLPGSHWVCYYVENINGEIIWDFFDSYAESTEFYGLAVPPGILRERNDKVYQRGNTNTCGQFCLHFVYHRSIGISFKKYNNIFKGMDFSGEFIVNKVYKNISLNKNISKNESCIQCCNTRAENNFHLYKRYGNNERVLNFLRQ